MYLLPIFDINSIQISEGDIIALWYPNPNMLVVGRVELHDLCFRCVYPDGWENLTIPHVRIQVLSKESELIHILANYAGRKHYNSHVHGLRHRRQVDDVTGGLLSPELHSLQWAFEDNPVIHKLHKGQ